MQYKKYIPAGMKDILFEECILKRKVENKLRDIYESRGYSEIITPTVEYSDVFNSRDGNVPDEKIYKTSNGRGRDIVMRPDVTSQIARVAGTKLCDMTSPIRLYYNQNIFRRQTIHSGRYDEMTQSGIELIGAEGLEADIEAVTTAINALTAACSPQGFRLEIGHAGLFKAIVNELKANGKKDDEIEIIREMVERKNFAALERIDDSTLKTVPKLFGGGEILDKASELTKNPEALSALNYMRTLYNELVQLGFGEKIIIDLGLVNGLNYYTGLIFNGYMDGSGQSVISGGRYDNLIGAFGRDIHAIGFAINVDAVVNTILSGEIKNKPLRLSLTKGRLETETIELFKRIGYDCSELEDKGRKLILSIKNNKNKVNELQIVLSKAPDVITYVEHGVCDIGIVGKDTIMECGNAFYEVMDLGFGKCRFVVAGIKGKDIYSGYGHKRIATKYPLVAAEHFAKRGLDVDIIKIEGSVELAPLLELSDAIVDLTETGNTLRENGLEVYEEICDISARLIVNHAAMKMRKDEINELINLLQKD